MPAEEEAAKRLRLAALGTVELVDLWDEPMPASSRALILAELTRRGYRTKGLPVPPPDDATTDPLPTPEEQDDQRIHGSALLLLVIGIMQILSAAYSLWKLRESGLFSAVIGSCIPLAIGIAFLVLHRRARTRPHPALTIGLILYVALKAVEAVLVVIFADPVPYVAGLPMAGLVLIGLGFGAASWRRSKTVAAVPEPAGFPQGRVRGG